MIVILLPAYNEASGISQLLHRTQQALQGEPYQIIVVNDGSSDNTVKLVEDAAKNAPITLISHSKNQGLGRAMHTGIEYVCTHWESEDILVTMDADNTHDPELIHEMLNELKESAEIVVASRFVGEATQVGFPIHRKVLSAGARIIFTFLYPLDTNDYTSGYRMYRIGLLQRALQAYDPFIESKGFVVMVEIILKLSRLNPKVSQVPLVLRYDLKEGDSKMKVIKTLREYLKMLMRVRRHYPKI